LLILEDNKIITTWWSN